MFQLILVIRRDEKFMIIVDFSAVERRLIITVPKISQDVENFPQNN